NPLASFPVLNLPRHRALGVFSPDLGGLLATATGRGNHDAFLDLVDDVRRANRVEEVDVVGLAGSHDSGTGGGHLRWVWLLVVIREAKRHAHVARPPLRESEAGNFQAFLALRQGPLVFNLQTEKKLALGVQRPGIGDVEILADRYAPDFRGGGLATASAPPLI